MSRLSAPPPTRPPLKDDSPKPKPASPGPNGKLYDIPLPSSKQAAVAAAAKARSPSPEPPKPHEVRDDKPVALLSALDGVSQQSDDSEFPVIDMETFEQILELDEDDDREFSSEMVWQYFSQAQMTFTDMDKAFKEKNLTQLSNLGHFLKGSSAALGVARVQATCERIQHLGKLWDEDAQVSLTETLALKEIEPLLKRGKSQYSDAEAWLKKWYKERGITPPVSDD